MIWFLLGAFVLASVMNLLLLWAYNRVCDERDNAIFKFNKLCETVDREVEARVAAVHAQWKSYVDQIAKPGQA